MVTFYLKDGLIICISANQIIERKETVVASRDGEIVAAFMKAELKGALLGCNVDGSEKQSGNEKIFL